MLDEEGSSLTQILQRSLIELTLAYDATFEGFGWVLDLREGETVGHTSQVTAITVIFHHGQCYGLMDHRSSTVGWFCRPRFPS